MNPSAAEWDYLGHAVRSTADIPPESGEEVPRPPWLKSLERGEAKQRTGIRTNLMPSPALPKEMLKVQINGLNQQTDQNRNGQT